MSSDYPYQIEAVNATMEGFKTFRKQCGVMGTGGGKTRIFSRVIERFQPERSLVLCHRDELIKQAHDKLYKQSGIFAQIEKAEHKASLSAPVVISSVQTMSNRLGKWPHDHFALVVADEAHRSLAPQWQKCLTHFSGYQLGVTATPLRSDGQELGSYYENYPFNVPMRWLIDHGFIARIKIKTLPIKIDTRQVGRGADGDFDKAETAHAIEPYFHSIAEQIYEHAFFRKTLVFLPLIATSKKFVQACKDVGLTAAHIDGESEDRDELTKRFEGEDFQVMGNAMLWTEGYDNPSIDAILVLRFTRFFGLYSQMIGRGTRLHTGKQNLLLMECLHLHKMHNIAKKFKIIRGGHLLANSEEEADMANELVDSKYGDEQIDIQQLCSETQKQREEKLRKELAKRANQRSKTVDAMEFCLAMEGGEDFEPVSDWKMKPVDPGQREILEKFDIDLNSLKGNSHADKIIGLIVDRERKGLATPKQLKQLIRFNHPEANVLTKGQAGKFLGEKYASFK